jgi:hypothetical protein
VLETVAVPGYRWLRDVVVPLGRRPRAGRVKDHGETVVDGQGLLQPAPWRWPER